MPTGLTVMVGSVFERSHIPLAKWVIAFHLMAASKKGVSAHQLHRMLGITYKSAWFMAMRIREAMRPASPGPIGGVGRIVEADETFVGGKGKNKAYGPTPKKQAVFALVEREGEARSFHIANVTAKTLRPIIVMMADRKSHFMTDEGKWYVRAGEEFASHHTVEHGAKEYVRGLAHTNTIEGYFSLIKRGITGIYHHVSEAHLHRYLAEFDFRYNNRSAVGIEDAERANKAIKGSAGKRLTYRESHKAAHA